MANLAFVRRTMTTPSEFTTISVELNGMLGILTLRRPERLNAMNGTMLLELSEAARQSDKALQVRVVIVQGEGRAFCAGADLHDSPSRDAGPDSEKSWF